MALLPIRRDVAVVSLASLVLGLGFGHFLHARPAFADDERARNEAAYERERDRLRRDFSGGPVVAIVGGEVLGGFDTLEAAAAAADARRPDATHRFLFRPGLEDREESIAMSPWEDVPGGQGEMAGNWLQIGHPGLAAKGLELTIGSEVFVRHRDKSTKFPRAPYARFTIATPDGKASRDASYVLSTLMDDSVTVTEALASGLGLERFSVPGGARQAGTEKEEPRAPYGKVRLRVRLRDVGFDEEMIAVVVPGRTVESTLRGILSTTEKIEVRSSLSADAAEPKVIDSPAEVRRIVAAAMASLVPAGPPAGWSWPNEVHFVTADGRRLVTSIGSAPGLFGVRLPEGTRSRDYRLSPELEAALRPYLAPR